MKNLAMAVVIRDSKVLVQRRYRRSLGMVFEFPGGSIDSGEIPEQAAIRELAEETGIELEESLGCYKYANEFGGAIYFVLLKADKSTEPSALDPERKQIFHWFSASKMPLGDFHKSDIEFISSELGKYI